MISQEEKALIENITHTFEESHKLIEENKSLREELRNVKEFLGYNSDMTIEEMAIYKEQCEEEDKVLREHDPSFASHTKNGEYIVNLVVEIGECEYTLVNVTENLKKLIGNEQKKEFCRMIDHLRILVKEDEIIELLTTLKQYISLNKRIQELDKKIINSRED